MGTRDTELLTETCEIITFPQLSCAAIKITKEKILTNLIVQFVR